MSKQIADGRRKKALPGKARKAAAAAGSASKKSGGVSAAKAAVKKGAAKSGGAAASATKKKKKVATQAGLTKSAKGSATSPSSGASARAAAAKAAKAKAASAAAASVAQGTSAAAADKAEAQAATTSTMSSSPPPACEPAVSELLNSLGVDAMRRCASELGYDLLARPLEKVSKQRLQQACTWLNGVENELRKADVNPHTLTSLSGFYYNSIAHDFHGEEWTRHVINSHERLARERLLLDALAHCESTHRCLRPLQLSVAEQYEKLRCEVEPVNEKSADWATIEQYLSSTNAPWVSGFELRLRRVFSCQRITEARQFEQHSSESNRWLLWLGAPPSNWLRTLLHGPAVAPGECEVACGLRAVRFSDSSTAAVLAAQAGRSPSSSSSGSAAAGAGATEPSTVVLALVEVALGKNGKRMPGEPDVAPGKSDSFLTYGRLGPRAEKKLQKIRVPLGPLLSPKIPLKDDAPLYNEYAVSASSRVRLRYLTEVELRPASNTSSASAAAPAEGAA
eukprot:TRINITY_DN46068_c0_g1_i1.p1 TRINITY_DN46068_c0_g1~~TRINITY_DN46068_c0_g1_i1.p1  ORF type:complete len:529 (+),score=143.29 TRINITY_DN46068_c0_g1_i1:63-1589(+)